MAHEEHPWSDGESGRQAAGSGEEPSQPDPGQPQA